MQPLLQQLHFVRMQSFASIVITCECGVVISSFAFVYLSVLFELYFKSFPLETSFRYVGTSS